MSLLFNLFFFLINQLLEIITYISQLIILFKQIAVRIAKKKSFIKKTIKIICELLATLVYLKELYLLKIVIVLIVETLVKITKGFKRILTVGE